MRILLISLAIVCISACGFVGFPGVYKINIEQGNIVTQEMVDQLKPGMNRRQVRFIMGTPLIEDTFNRNRWDYIFELRNGSKVLSQSKLTVEFEGDTLTKVFGDLVPEGWGASAASAAAPTTKPATAPISEPAPGIPTSQ